MRSGRSGFTRKPRGGRRCSGEGWESLGRRDWRRAIRKSRSTSAKSRSTMDFRATRTAETGRKLGAVAPECFAEQSLGAVANHRPPMVAGNQTHPVKIQSGRPGGIQLRIRHPWTTRRPSDFRRTKSAPTARRRWRRPRRDRVQGSRASRWAERKRFRMYQTGVRRRRPWRRRFRRLARPPLVAMRAWNPVLADAANLGGLILAFHEIRSRGRSGPGSIH